jgi:hypothetical protein
MQTEPPPLPHAERRRFARGVTGFVVGIALTIGVFGLDAWKLLRDTRERKRLIMWLSIPTVEYRVSVEHRAATNPTAIITALRGIVAPNLHHSGPTSPLLIDISTQSDSRRIVVARDSADAHEYWVFLADRSGLARSPGRAIDDPGSEIGRVFTEAFIPYESR